LRGRGVTNLKGGGYLYGVECRLEGVLGEGSLFIHKLASLTVVWGQEQSIVKPFIQLLNNRLLGLQLGCCLRIKQFISSNLKCPM